MRTFHLVNVFGNEPRHKMAHESWARIYSLGIVPLHNKEPYPRNAKKIGDPRSLPYLKDQLSLFTNKSQNSNDVALWSNDDIIFDERIIEWCNKVSSQGAMSMRRTEIGKDWVHMGRDVFGFSKAWLDLYQEEIPDFIIGCPVFDLVIAAIIRRSYGLLGSTIENMIEDWPPAEDGQFSRHTPHRSSWTGPREAMFKANRHNQRLGREWAEKNMPSLKL